MPFTAQELESISNAMLDFHIKEGVKSQTLQNKPLLAAMRSKRRPFPGGKEKITKRVKFDYTTGVQGYSHDDQVDYANPANIKEASVNWYELHAGITVTHTELKKAGISVVDSTTGAKTVTHSQTEKIALCDILQDKLEDMTEGSDRGLNLMLWRDGTQDSKLVPGVRYFVRNDPTAAVVVAGIDQSAVTGWRNRASLAINASTASNQNLVNTLQKEYRQLIRYGGKPDLWLAGSDLMDAFEKELRALGNYTETGWAKNGGAIDASIADIAFKGHRIVYDPTLDDEGLSKYLYCLDTKALKLFVMDGEDGKPHNPARPEDRYTMYRAMTWTWGMFCFQRNSSGVYSIA